MASIQRIVSPLTGEVSYRVQVRRKGRSADSARFPNRKEAVAWAESLETSIREGRHFPHAAAKRTSFDALAKDYVETVLAEIAALSHALSFAVKERRLLQRNPVSDIRRKPEPRGRTRFLSDDDRARLIKACAESAWPALHTLVLLAITTGARKGELIGLKWDDVDLKKGRALVSETKNDEPRTLPLAGKALEALRALKLKASARSEYVFPQPSGLPGPYEHFDAHWYAALEAAGIKDFHFHDLRHTTASMLAAQGASLLEIADVLGHKTLAMVKRYSHLVVDHKAKVIENMVAAKGL